MDERTTTAEQGAELSERADRIYLLARSWRGMQPCPPTHCSEECVAEARDILTELRAIDRQLAAMREAWYAEHRCHVHRRLCDECGRIGFERGDQNGCGNYQTLVSRVVEASAKAGGYTALEAEFGPDCHRKEEAPSEGASMATTRTIASRPKREPLHVELRRFVSDCEHETGLTILEVRKVMHSGHFEETSLISRWLQADRMLEWLDRRTGVQRRLDNARAALVAAEGAQDVR